MTLHFKAAQLMLLRDRQLGADIFINKNIPIGAGLGGWKLKCCNSYNGY